MAATGLPVLHAFAGPLALLSLGFGCSGTAIGQFQKQWRFAKSYYQPSIPGGGGGDAPPRFFSRPLWGTIVYKDETIRLPQNILHEILSLTPFSQQVENNLNWSKWESHKHLIFAIASTITEIEKLSTCRARASFAIEILENAARLHNDIISEGIILRDNTNSYQLPWRRAMSMLIQSRSETLDFMEATL